MKVTTYTINEGTASQYYGLKSVSEKQVPELLRCKNWKICDSCDKGVCKTYYIDILPA